jgi:hypothetical protein
MKTILAWVLALLAVVGIGVGVEAAIGVAPSTPTGVLRVTGSLDSRAGSLAFYRGYLVEYLCTGVPAEGSSLFSCPAYSPPQPAFTVRVMSSFGIEESLTPGPWTILGSPCGGATVEVKARATQRISVVCTKPGS